MNKNMLYRSIPKVDVLLENSDIVTLIENHHRDVVVDVIREEIDKLRNFIKENDDVNLIETKINNLIENIKISTEKVYSYNIKKVINGTGTILHTNLGRAIISKKHAEAAMAVNNNAAAVMLVLSSMAAEREVIVSRGELVEVGGKFRIPDVMKSSNAHLVEIGTTNKTHLEDYEDAISENTGAFLKVHTSNFKILGFTESVSIEELCKLGREKDIPVIEDIGSGVLIDLSKYGLEYEPTVQDSIKAGVDVVSFSGDKLLGGPQAGIIVGKKKYIDKMKKNPLTRAFRIDKFTATILEMIFHEYLNEEDAIKNIPVLSLITKDLKEIEKNANALFNKIENLENVADINVEDTFSQIGGGSLPAERIKSKSVTIMPKNISTQSLEAKLRAGKNPVVGRISEEKLIIDMRTVLEDEIDILAQKLIDILK